MKGALETVPWERRPNARSGCRCGEPEECRAALRECDQHTPARCRRQPRCEPHQIVRHRVIAYPCRAQASSMPEGPATGRVEAQRRALTRPSTAPASSERWWCDSDQYADDGRVLQGRGACARTDSCGRQRHTSGRVHVHAEGAMLPHDLGMQPATRATASDGVNDPVRAPWGQMLGTAAGSFTPSFLQ